MRSIFRGSGDQETCFFDLGVSGIKTGVMVGDSGREKYFSGEDAEEKGLFGELGAVSKPASLLESEPP
jgi:hypothetical protein